MISNILCIANQVSYAFQHVLLYFHNKNGFTKLIPFLCTNPVPVDLKDGWLPTVDMVMNSLLHYMQNHYRVPYVIIFTIGTNNIGKTFWVEQNPLNPQHFLLKIPLYEVVGLYGIIPLHVHINMEIQKSQPCNQWHSKIYLSFEFKNIYNWHCRTQNNGL